MSLRPHLSRVLRTGFLASALLALLVPDAWSQAPDADTAARPVATHIGAVRLAGADGRLGGDEAEPFGGEVLGSSTTHPFSTCDAINFSVGDRSGAYRLAPGTLNEGTVALALEAAPKTAARTLWRLEFQSLGAAAIDLDYRFSVRSAEGAGYYAIRLDDRLLACGESRSAGLAPWGDRLATRVRSLELPLAERVVAPGRHVLEVLVSRGSAAAGDTWMDVGNVRLVGPSDLPPDACHPAPPGDMGEVVDPSSTQRRWIFDDNRYCSDGPGIDCRRGGINPNPGTNYVDSTGGSFEMYVVADCGTEMHVPLFDVEGGCISVFHEDDPVTGVRSPVAIQVSNGAGFNQMGGEVCWNATNCSGMGNPGGPGNVATMDVSFTGSPTLCGVFVVKFKSWSGCIWDLFANCNGTNTEQFRIFDNICTARMSVSPRPEIVVENLVTSDHGDCTVDYCVDAHNIGCGPSGPTILRVTNGVQTVDHIVGGLGLGGRQTFCGNLPVTGSGPAVPTTVTATADPDDTLVECTESANSSSCSPATGGDTQSTTQTMGSCRPPVCDPGGPYATPCVNTTGPNQIQIDGSASNDPDGGPIQFAWTTTCPGTLDNATVPDPVLTVPGQQCALSCEMGLTVTDTTNRSTSCTAPVTIDDVTPPVLAGVPANASAECDAVPPPPAVTATDACDPDVPVSYMETRTDGTCPQSYTLTRVWTASDDCGNPTQETRTVTVSDTTPPVLSGVPPNLSAECDAVPPPPTVTATDNCDSDVPVSFTETRTNGNCPANYVLTRTWTAVDDCGNQTQVTRTVTVSDTTPPVLSGVPPNLSAECDAVPPPPTVTAADNCDPSVPVTFTETRTNGNCPANYVLTRTWTAVDDCGNQTQATRTVTVSDTTPPVLSGVPPDLSAECDAVPPPPTVTATDNCDPDVPVSYMETRIDGNCPSNYTLVRTWTATDDCGNQTQATRTVTVTDTTPPVLSGVPPDATAECDAVPPPATVTATDNCDPDVPVTFSEDRADGSCPQSYTLTRTWTATDDCGNTTSASQTVTVRDTTPPVVTPGAGNLYCLWPPNHWYICFTPGQFSPVITDNCGAVTWRFAGCGSDQCDDAPCPEHPGENGDGSTTNDCVVLPQANGGFCVRSERAGTDPEGRHYGITIIATDACGNSSGAVPIGDLYVPHDQSPHERPCLDPTKVGCRPNQSIPCPRRR